MATPAIMATPKVAGRPSPMPPAAEAQTAPTTAAALHSAWNPVRIALPYLRSIVTACMFMPASTAPRHRPNSTFAATSSGTPAASPASTTARPARGWATRSTTLLPYRLAISPARTLPAPAITGTTRSRMDSSPSLSPCFFCRAATWVSRVANVSPWTKKTAKAARRARRSRGVGTTASEGGQRGKHEANSGFARVWSRPTPVNGPERRVRARLSRRTGCPGTVTGAPPWCPAR